MTDSDTSSNAEAAQLRRLFVYNSGFLTQRRIKRILSLAGWQVALGRPDDTDWVGVWGAAPSAERGVVVAASRDASVLRVEDAFLRSLHPGRVSHEPPIGLLLDRTGMHFDASKPSDLETLLRDDPLDDTAQLNTARGLMDRWVRSRLSKYCAYDPDLALPEPGYVLVLDQAEGDASVRASLAGETAAHARFAEMLYYAQTEHPNARILIRSHPETAAEQRGGHYQTEQATGRVSFVDGAHAPADLFEGAIAVYTLSSQMGFEAILAGHKPRVFGTPFYAGWGLTEDEHAFTRRQRKLTRAQLFAGAMMRFPVWYDPYEDRLCDLSRVMDSLEAQQRAWMDDRFGWVGENIRLWKRPHMQAFFGRSKPMRFGKRKTGSERVMIWGTKAPGSGAGWGVEDGFLRSQGLGAELVPPLSLALDNQGMYYDPRSPSRLEHLIGNSTDLPGYSLERAQRLIKAIVESGATKYASGVTASTRSQNNKRPVILVPGQVEDDASIQLGSPEIKSNAALLERVRRANPEATLLYKPHPDVVAGLRPGHVTNALDWADEVVDGPIATLFTEADSLWTMTSLAGFEALLRDVPVTTLGLPFYAGWGLTTDLCPIPDRRGTLVSLEGLVHATLIAYPRYMDPKTGLPCPVEVALDRLITGDVPKSARLRILAKAQGLLASYSALWRC
mgnify:CR=1 FL=1